MVATRVQFFVFKNPPTDSLSEILNCILVANDEVGDFCFGEA